MNEAEVGGKSDFVDLKMMMMGTMIPSFLKAAKPFRKYETTAAVAAPQLRRNAKEPLRWVFIFFMTKVLETERLKKKLLHIALPRLQTYPKRVVSAVAHLPLV